MGKSVGRPSGVAAKVEALVKPSVESLGLALWDVRYEKEGADWHLVVLVDRPGGVMDTDTCEKASRAIDPVLDEADPIAGSYILEVGSPGLGRKLCRAEHFEAMMGQKIRAGLYKPDAKGRKEVAGVLKGFDGLAAVLDTGGCDEAVPAAEAAGFWACDDEGLFR